MDNYATLHCVLKLHPRCDACKRRTMAILSSITGTYNITMDAERNEAMIVGQVHPNYCIRAISRCNGHAEPVWGNLKHPKIRSESYGRGSFGDSYGPPGYSSRMIPEYSYTPNNINYDYEYNRRRREPYRMIDYTAAYHSEEPMNLCTIL